MRRLWLIFAQATTVALALLFVVSTLKPEWLPARPLEVVSLRTAAPGGPSTLPAGPTAPLALPAGLGPAASVPFTGYHAAAQAAAPAVVSVTASKAGRRAGSDPHAGLGGRFPQQRLPDTQVGFGSGVIVSPEGILLTNNHVIEGATAIDVRLPDGRETRAEVVGTDPESDLAVLRITLDKLPSVTLGRLDSVQVGDVVLAIGNPFNVGQTVTSGIVSALGRQGLGLSLFEDFVQTDAAINPGNSGGALVDVRGQLIGINTAIFSRSGGSMGIGFAIPVDVAQQVMEGLLRDGRVTRGWIGVEPRELTPEFAEHFHLPVKVGVLITGVLKDGPASKAGVLPGDVVTSVAGKPVTSVAQLLHRVAALKPGQAAPLNVQRGPKALELSLMVAQRPQGTVAAPRDIVR